MKNMGTIFASIAIGVIIIILQVYLGKRKKWYWGAIIPVITIGFAVFVMANGLIVFSFRNLFPFTLLLVVECSIWEEGRKKVKDDKEKELEKMKGKDL